MVIGLAWSLAVPTTTAAVSWINPDGGNWSTATNWSSGTVPIAADDVLITLGGTYTVNLDVGATINSLTLGGTTGAQTLANSAQTLSLASASTVEARGVLAWGGGTLAGGGLLTVNGRIQFGAGAWYGAVSVAAGGLLEMTEAAEKGLAATLQNDGRITWSGTGNLVMAYGWLDNRPGGTFEIHNDQMITWGGGAPVFSNTGFFRKLGGSGATIVQNITFDNTGTVDIQTGAVLFACPYTQTGGQLNLGLNSLTNFGRVQFAGIAPLTGTLGANLNGGYRPRAGDAFAVVTYPARAGAFDGFDLPSVAAWVTNDTIYSATDVTLTVLNARPVLAVIGDRNLNEETPLNVPSTVDHPDLNQTVTYSLTQAPAGAQLDSATGVFSWTPGEAQGPSTNTGTVQVTDHGVPSLSDSQTFTVIVREVNRSPQWTAPASLATDELVLLQVPSVATDLDLPTNTLSFTLLSGPAGATVDPNSGRLTWTPIESQGPGNYTNIVRVTDNGEPPLSITNQLAVTVREVNTPPALTVPGAQVLDELTTLTVTNTVLDADLPVNALTFSLVSAPTGAQINPSTGVITWTPTEAQGPTNTTIRVQVTDNGTPQMSDTREFTVTVREVNLPPVLAAIPNQTILEGFSLVLTNVVTDPDLPANILTFSLVAPPAGFAIDPIQGILTWIPLLGQVPSTNRITVRVIDNGVPTHSDEQSFAAAVVPVPSLRLATDGDEVRIYWPGAAPGFVLQGAADLQPPIDWSDVTNAVGQIGDDRVVTNRAADSPQFFRLKRP